MGDKTIAINRVIKEGKATLEGHPKAQYPNNIEMVLSAVARLHPAFLHPISTTAHVSPVSNAVAQSILLSSPAQLLADTTIDNTIAAGGAIPSTQVFEAVAPDSSFFIGIGFVVLLCVVAGSVWANDVVPISRTKLAISKSRGGKWISVYFRTLDTIEFMLIDFAYLTNFS